MSIKREAPFAFIKLLAYVEFDRNIAWNSFLIFELSDHLMGDGSVVKDVPTFNKGTVGRRYDLVKKQAKSVWQHFRENVVVHIVKSDNKLEVVKVF